MFTNQALTATFTDGQTQFVSPNDATVRFQSVLAGFQILLCNLAYNLSMIALVKSLQVELPPRSPVLQRHTVRASQPHDLETISDGRASLLQGRHAHMAAQCGV